MEQVTNQILSELQSYSSQEGAAAHIGFDSSCSHSLSISQLQAELSEDDLHLLKLKADNILYRIIAIELGITPYAVPADNSMPYSQKFQNSILLKFLNSLGL